jgi:hypothetical protein
MLNRNADRLAALVAGLEVEAVHSRDACVVAAKQLTARLAQFTLAVEGQPVADLERGTAARLIAAGLLSWQRAETDRLCGVLSGKLLAWSRAWQALAATPAKGLTEKGER